MDEGWAARADSTAPPRKGPGLKHGVVMHGDRLLSGSPAQEPVRYGPQHDRVGMTIIERGGRVG